MKNYEYFHVIQQDGKKIYVLDTWYISYNLIDDVATYTPDVIKFTKNVKVIGKKAFQGVNCKNICFETATNVEEIQDSAFENAFNIHINGGLKNVKKLGKRAFYDAKIVDELVLDNVVEVPNECFAYTIAKRISLTNATELGKNVFQYIKCDELDAISPINTDDNVYIEDFENTQN